MKENQVTGKANPSLLRSSHEEEGTRMKREKEEHEGMRRSLLARGFSKSLHIATPLILPYMGIRKELGLRNLKRP